MTDHPDQQATNGRRDEPTGGETPPVADPDPPRDPRLQEGPADAATDREPAGAGPTADGEASAGTPADDADEFSPEQIDALVAERDEFLDAYRRTAADFDNFRKLSQKRLADEVARAKGSFVERLLPVLDAIDAARSQGTEKELAGVEAVAGALYGFLEKEGLERVHPEHEPFDPNVSEAVVHEPGEDGTPESGPVVSEVLRTGYLWQGRVIRPAMVKVSG
jgi:molecular chaperone GrpE